LQTKCCSSRSVNGDPFGIPSFGNRLPDADIKDIRKMVYSMVRKGLLASEGGNKIKSYQLAKKINEK